MNCMAFDENILRPCGKRCKDFKQVLLEISHAEDQELLSKILEKLYFGTKGEPGQKKGVILTQKTDLFDLNDQPVLVFALLDGTNNLEFIQLVEQAKDFVHGFGYNSASFSNIYLVVRTYNKCFCDQCIYRYLFRPWMSITEYYFRMFVYDDFYIGIYQYFIRLKQGTSLVQQAIHAATTYFKCCQHNYRARDRTIWLGNGNEPMSSSCALAPKGNFLSLFVTKFWHQLPTKSPWLLRDASENILRVYTPDGYILHIKNFPPQILFYLRDTHDLFFIYKTRRNFKIIVYDVNYLRKKAKYT